MISVGSEPVTFSLVGTSAALSALVCIGAVIGWVVRSRRDRKQLEMVTTRLLTEQRIEAVTRAALQAMREAVRRL